MGLLRRLFGFIGVVLIALPFLPLDLLPQETLVEFISNDVLSIVAGILVLVLVFMSWNRERKMRRMLFMGPRGLRGARMGRGISDADIRRMQDVQRLRALGA